MTTGRGCGGGDTGAGRRKPRPVDRGGTSRRQDRGPLGDFRGLVRSGHRYDGGGGHGCGNGVGIDRPGRGRFGCWQRRGRCGDGDLRLGQRVVHAFLHRCQHGDRAFRARLSAGRFWPAQRWRLSGPRSLAWPGPAPWRGSARVEAHVQQLRHPLVAGGGGGAAEDGRDDAFVATLRRGHQVEARGTGVAGLDPVRALVGGQEPAVGVGDLCACRRRSCGARTGCSIPGSRRTGAGPGWSCRARWTDARTGSVRARS